MADIFRLYICILRFNLYAKILFGCLHIKWIVIWSAGIWILETPKLQAATENSVSPKIVDNGNLPSGLSRQISSAGTPENLKPEPETASRFEDSSVELHYPSKPLPQLMAAPENFNPELRLPPPQPLPPQPLPPQPSPSQPPASTEPVTPAVKLESLTTDFRRDTDQSGQGYLLIEETAQFRLRNGNRFRLRTGFNSFEQREFESVTNIPLRVEWEGKVDRVNLTVGGGVDVFDRLPTALNFNAKAEVPLGLKVSPSGQLQSVVLVSVVVEQGSYKSNVQTLENQITAWRFGPNIYWQIDPKTSLYSSLRLGSYNDGNFEQQSFSRLERKIGDFSIAANLFEWGFTRNAEETSGYYSPQSFIVFSGEVAFEKEIFDFLQCRVAASMGRQRINGNSGRGNSYQATCTTRLTPNVDADFGYTYSNVPNRDTGGSVYNNRSFTGQLRLKF